MLEDSHSRCIIGISESKHARTFGQLITRRLNMSIKHWLKGMRRRAARRGLGRGRGNLEALFIAQERQRRREERAARGKPVDVEGTRKERRADALSMMVAQDRKRSARVHGKRERKSILGIEK